MRINLRSRAVLSRTRPAELQTNSLSSLAGWLARWLIQKLASQPHDSGHCVGRYPPKKMTFTPVWTYRRENAEKCTPAVNQFIFQTRQLAHILRAWNRRKGLRSEPHAPPALPAPRRTPHTDSAPNSAAVSPLLDLPLTDSTRRSLLSWYSSGSFIKTEKCCRLLLSLLEALLADFFPRPKSRTNSRLSFDVSDVRRTGEGGGEVLPSGMLATLV